MTASLKANVDLEVEVEDDACGGAGCGGEDGGGEACRGAGQHQGGLQEEVLPTLGRQPGGEPPISDAVREAFRFYNMIFGQKGLTHCTHSKKCPKNCI